MQELFERVPLTCLVILQMELEFEHKIRIYRKTNLLLLHSMTTLTGH